MNTPGSEDLPPFDSPQGHVIGGVALFFNIAVTAFLLLSGISRLDLLSTLIIVFMWSVIFFAGIATLISSGCSLNIFVPIMIFALIGFTLWSYTTLTCTSVMVDFWFNLHFGFDGTTHLEHCTGF